MSERVEDGSESGVMWLLVLLPEHTLIEFDDHFVPTKMPCWRRLIIVVQQARVY
jgi:hypothetical protein